MGPPPQLGHRRRSVPSGPHLRQGLAGDLHQQHAPVRQRRWAPRGTSAPRPPRSSPSSAIGSSPSARRRRPGSLNTPAGDPGFLSGCRHPGRAQAGDRLGAHQGARTRKDRGERGGQDTGEEAGEASRMEGMEYRIEHDTMGEVRVPASARWGAQTQRAIENFPISGEPLDRRLVHALALIKAEAARVNAALGVVDPPTAEAIAAAAEEVAAGTLGRPVPRRRVPDRLGHLHQHERQRGRGPPGGGAARAATSTPTTTSTPASPPTTCSPRAIHLAAAEAVADDLLPALAHLEAGAAGQGRRVRPGREVGPHPPHGRHAGDAGPGVRRLRRPGRRGGERLRSRCPGSGACRSAAPPSAPG